MRTLLGNFGNVLVFLFYADWNKPSKEFVQNFTNSIDIFGQYDNVRYFSICSEKCPDIFKKFDVEKTPTTIITQTDKKILHRENSDEIGNVFEVLAQIS